MTKKEDILRNVAKIIHEEGIQKLTIDYVAHKSDITKGGVLYHFKSKGQLILKMNEMVIEQYEKSIQQFQDQLTGAYQFTRAYAYATLDMLNNPDDVLLPAVFISSQESGKSKQLWMQVSKKWDEQFQKDKGDAYKMTELRMICDGVWFSMMYQYGDRRKEEMKQIIERHCDALEGEAY